MLTMLKVPRGVANLFVLGNSSEITITEEFNHRPDKILDQYGMKSFVKEMVNNYMSNISPISCKNGIPYIVTDSLFNGYFVRNS